MSVGACLHTYILTTKSQSDFAHEAQSKYRCAGLQIIATFCTIACTVLFFHIGLAHVARLGLFKVCERARAGSIL